MHLSRSLFVLLAGAMLASAADSALLTLVPRDPKLIAGLDFERAKGSALGQRILAEMKDEDKGFREFVTFTGFDPRRDLREVILASDGKSQGDSSLILVRGTFDLSKISAYLSANGATPAAYKGVQVWTKPQAAKREGTIAIVDSNLALFGSEQFVKDAIDRLPASSPAISDALWRRVTTWSANDAWFLTTAPFADLGVNSNGKNKLVPQGLATDAVRASSAGVKFGTVIQVTSEALMRSDKDAQALADVFRFIVSMVRLNSDKPEANQFLKLLDAMQLTVTGSTVQLSLQIPETELFKLLDNKGARAESIFQSGNEPEGQK